MFNRAAVNFKYIRKQTSSVTYSVSMRMRISPLIYLRRQSIFALLRFQIPHKRVKILALIAVFSLKRSFTYNF